MVVELNSNLGSVSSSQLLFCHAQCLAKVFTLLGSLHILLLQRGNKIDLIVFFVDNLHKILFNVKVKDFKTFLKDR